MFRGGVRLVNAMSSTPALRRAHWQQTMLRGTLFCEEQNRTKKNELNLGPGQGHLDPSPTLPRRPPMRSSFSSSPP